MESQLESIKADIEQLESFISTSTRPRVETMIKSNITLLQAELSNIEAQIQKISEITANSHSKAEAKLINYEAIKGYSYDQESKFVKIYLTLNGIGSIPKENIECDFSATAFDIKIHGLEKKNLRYSIKKLFEKIDPAASKFVVKNNSIVITLIKTSSKHWDQLHWKEPLVLLILIKVKPATSEKSKEDPGAGLMDMMKKMYQEGDDDMKRTIGQAWVYSAINLVKGAD